MKYGKTSDCFLLYKLLRNKVSPTIIHTIISLCRKSCNLSTELFILLQRETLAYHVKCGEAEGEGGGSQVKYYAPIYTPMNAHWEPGNFLFFFVWSLISNQKEREIRLWPNSTDHRTLCTSHYSSISKSSSISKLDHCHFH